MISSVTVEGIDFLYMEAIPPYSPVNYVSLSQPTSHFFSHCGGSRFIRNNQIGHLQSTGIRSHDFLLRMFASKFNHGLQFCRRL